MTEDEAKTKWCPHARVLNWGLADLESDIKRDTNSPDDPYEFRSYPAINREFTKSTDQESAREYANWEGSRCIGSDCMMWRQTIAAMPLNERLAEGYCGLAGKP